MCLIGTNNNKNQMIVMKSVIENSIKKFGFEGTYDLLVELKLDREIRYMELKKISDRDNKILDLLS